MQIKITIVGGEIYDFDTLDEFLALAAVFDEVLDGTNLELVFAGEFDELRQPGHGAVVVHDFAEDADGPAIGEGDEVDDGLGMAGALEDAAGLGSQGKHVAG